MMCDAEGLPDTEGHDKTFVYVEFPRNFSDLDRSLTQDLYTMPSYAMGYNDAKYRSFRDTCVLRTKMYTLGTPIPSLQYPPYQVQTWARAFSRLKELYPTHACSKFNCLLEDFVDTCGISTDAIPDLEKISSYLTRKTGFRLRPVSTYIAPRDFLASLAFRVFCSAQYVRPDEAAFFTNEPDIIHDVLGHAVLLCDPDFANFSQEIGLASLGTPADILDKLASVYMAIAEAGLCREGSGLKAYGALLLSGASELEHALTGEGMKRPLDLEMTSSIDLDLGKYRDVYYVTESVDEAICMARAYLSSLPHRLSVKHSPDTNTIMLQA